MTKNFSSLVLLMSCFATYVTAQRQLGIQRLSSPPAGKRIISDNGVAKAEGSWSNDWEMCPTGTRATGFFIKSESYQGHSADDTSVNGIALICGEDRKYLITSEVGLYGQWGKGTFCPKTYFIATFRLSMDAPSEGGSKVKYDEIGVDNIHFMCVPVGRIMDDRIMKEEPKDNSRSKAIGSVYRRFLTAWSDRCSMGICGINTNVDVRSKGGSNDITGLNDVRFVCC